MSFEPEGLELRVVVGRELMGLEDPVQLFEVGSVEGYQRLGLKDTFVAVEFVAGGQTPEEPAQPVHIAGLL